MSHESEYDEVERFERKGHEVVIRTIGDRTELVLDGEPHEVKFLDNGRPWTSAFVNVMAKDVHDLAEKWIDIKTAQEAHWAEVDEQRKAKKKKRKRKKNKHNVKHQRKDEDNGYEHDEGDAS